MSSLIPTAPVDKLVELKGYRNDPDYLAYRKTIDDRDPLIRLTTIKTFVDYLHARNYKQVKYGSYGIVFQHKALDDYCVKIFKNDPAYLHFVKIVLSDPTNPYFPRFRGRFMRIEDYYAVRMEILTPLSNEDWNTISLLVTLMRKNLPYEEQYFEVDEHYPGLIDNLEWLKTSRNGFALDWHQGNFMQRGSQIVITDPYIGNL